MSPRKQILFLSQRIPFPPDKGDKIRSFRLLEHLRRFGDVHAGFFIDDDHDWQYLSEIEDRTSSFKAVKLDPLFARLRSLKALATGDPLSKPYFFAGEMQSYVDNVVATHAPSAIVIFSSAMAQYVSGFDHRNLLIDYVDVDSDKWRQYAKTRKGLARWVYGREARTLLDFDRAIGAEAALCSFVSAQDADLFRSLAPELAEKVSAISNGIDVDYFSPEAPEAQLRPETFGAGPQLVMTGHMDYWPNVEGALWFAEETFPIIQDRHKDAEFHIVGAAPRADLVKLADSNDAVHVTGRVPDVRPYLSHADVVVAPIRIARGIQNKVLEGMAMGRCVVTTSQGFEGIDAIPGEHLMLGDNAAGFAHAVLSALSDPDRDGFGQKARKHLQENYNWTARLSAFDPFL